MAEQTISVRTYGIVTAILVALTVLTVAISFFPLPGFWHLMLGLLIAFCKGALVLLFFMHVLISSRLIWIVVLVTAFWYSILVVLTLSDYFSRDLVPYTPGH